jgi:hypothetical protein
MLWVSSSINMSPYIVEGPKSHELEDPELVNVVKTTFQPIDGLIQEIIQKNRCENKRQLMFTNDIL